MSFIRCERCNFTENQSINSTDEYGAAVGIYLGNQFGSRESTQAYEFTDWSACMNYDEVYIILFLITPLLSCNAAYSTKIKETMGYLP